MFSRCCLWRQNKKEAPSTSIKTFSLSEKKCIKLSSRSLSITWGNSPEYWSWIPSSEPKSSFEEVAMLNAVCWLEIRGKMDTELLSPGTRYGVYFVFKLTDDAYGFKHQPVEVKVVVSGAADKTVMEKSVYLDIEEGQTSGQIVLKQRNDGWSEIEMGELYVEEGKVKEVVMSVLEVKVLNWKSGIMVEGIEVRPM